MTRHDSPLTDPAATSLWGMETAALTQRKSRPMPAKIGRSALEQPHRRPKSNRSALKSARISAAPTSPQSRPKSKSPYTTAWGPRVRASPTFRRQAASETLNESRPAASTDLERLP